jgi:hypothetical protein
MSDASPAWLPLGGQLGEAPARSGFPASRWAHTVSPVAGGALLFGGYSSLVVDEVSPGMGGILYERNDTAGDVISFTPFPLLF